MSLKTKKARGIERLKVRYGRMFILPWFIGLLLFFLIPLVSSIAYAFSKVDLSNGISMKYIGLENFKTLLGTNPDYERNIRAAVSSFFTSLPIILSLSLIFAVVLNQKFRGRLLARAIFFLPVIIATGVVMQYIMGNKIGSSGSASGAALSTALGGGDSAMRFSAVLTKLGLPDRVTLLLNDYIADVFNLIWSCGIQILLFVAGMQSIPDQMYEVSKIEGATTWEEFWYVTFPMLGNVILLVLIYTMVDQITAYDNPVMNQAYDFVGKNIDMYGDSAAALWLYFVIVGVLSGIVLFAYQRVFLRRWN